MKVILLNGPSSSGKSSIAKCLKMKFEKRNKCKIVALDDYLVMTNNEPIWEDDVFELTPQMCKDIHELLSDGYVVIVDHVITSERIYQAIIDVFGEDEYKSVMVSCDIEILRKRELQRGDRYVGSSEASVEYLYPKDNYDLVVDSSFKTSEIIAEEIFAWMNC